MRKLWNMSKLKHLSSPSGWLFCCYGANVRVPQIDSRAGCLSVSWMRIAEKKRSHPLLCTPSWEISVMLRDTGTSLFLISDITSDTDIGTCFCAISDVSLCWSEDEKHASAGSWAVWRWLVKKQEMVPQTWLVFLKVLLLVNISRTTEYCSVADFILELLLKCVKMTILITKCDLRPALTSTWMIPTPNCKIPHQ